MKRQAAIPCIALFAFLLLGISLIVPSPALAEISHGEIIFKARCAECHGMKGAGTDKGPPLVHRTYHPNHHADYSFQLAVRRGVKAHHWGYGDMPPVSGVDSKEVDMIIKYVRGLQKEAGIF